MDINIKKIILQIQEQLNEKQTNENIAKSCYTSKMQLHRDFYNSTGYSVNEYIRHLRLSNALCMIKSSQLSLVDIAFSCGYSSQQAMCRDIKAIINTTANEYKKSNDYYFLSSILDETPFQIEVSKQTLPQTVCLKYYSYKMRGIENDVVQLFLLNNSSYSGRIFGRNGKQEAQSLCYELYVNNDFELNTNGFNVSGVYPSYEIICAQTRVKNIEDEINEAWDYLYCKWLPTSMFDYAGQSNSNHESQYFEEYFYKHQQATRLKLYLPIIKKKECLKVSIEKHNFSFIIAHASGYDAEKQACEKVTKFLSENYPFMIEKLSTFYINKKDNNYYCGFEIKNPLSHLDDLKNKCYENQSFAVLYMNGICEYEHSKDILMDWVRKNDFIIMDEPFAVYKIYESSENPEMKFYCPIRN